MANVLVIDDEENIKKSIEVALNIAGHNFIGVKDFEEMKRVMNKDNEFDVIILDLILPKVDGLQILDYLKNEKQIETPIIILTGHGDMESAVEALRNGAYDYKIKPIHRDDLLNVIKNALTEKEKKNLEKKLIQKETMAELSIIYSGIQHCIQDPLTRIGSNINEIRTLTKDDLIIGKLNEAEKNKNKIYSTANEIFELIRVIQKFGTTITSSIDLKKEIEKAINDIKDPYSELFENIEIKICIEKNLYVKISFRAIELILRNLVLNAIHAIKKKNIKNGEINIYGRQSANNINLEIEDNGCGISNKYSERIFEPFFTDKDNGTGLGLFIVKKLIEVYNGSIIHSTKENVGTKFFISFPKLEEEL